MTMTEVKEIINTKMTEEERADFEKEVISIIKTAKDLQNYCISQRCSNCAFHNSDGCILQLQAPCDWELDESGD
jgi:hypothetical protein